MSNRLAQPEEINMAVNEFSEYFAKSEIEKTEISKSKSSRKVIDDEHYIPLYKTSSFN